MKRWSIRLAVLIGLVLAYVVLRRTLLAPDLVEVRAWRVSRGVVEATISNTRAGTVKARRRAGLSTGTAGIVMELAVERGDRVAQGDVLLRIDDATQRSLYVQATRQLALAQARQAKACVAAERAGRSLQRNRELAADSIVSVDRLDDLQTTYELAAADCDVAAAEVAVAEATLETARSELDKTVLRAPFDAVIGEVSVEVGEWVSPSVPLMAAPDLIDAIDPSSLYVSAPMDEVDAGHLRVDSRARVTLDPVPDRTFEGRVVRVAPYVLDIERQNRTIEIEVELEDAAYAATLLPGTSADVEVLLEVRPDVLRVPTRALLEGGRVLVVEDEALVEHTLERGLRNWNWTEVVSGIESGWSVVTSLDRPGVEAGARARVEGFEEAP